MAVCPVTGPIIYPVPGPKLPERQAVLDTCEVYENPGGTGLPLQTKVFLVGEGTVILDEDPKEPLDCRHALDEEYDVVTKPAGTSWKGGLHFVVERPGVVLGTATVIPLRVVPWLEHVLNAPVCVTI
ncbi:hypothetical protein AB835_13205 [Candidatus Endobugula sertula]|uniref:Uncharacterized protein n=1 Tax=Candidatus Endobugula sertula TaxID=62101 RepID=A0A1D2QM12_9GAMM|nr:hypothetical protein AB835_13205 [Candidatus Endobugula sertula]